MEVDATQTTKCPLTEHQEKLKKEGHCFHCETQGHMSRDCLKKTNGPPPYSKVRTAMSQPMASTSNAEVAVAKIKMDEEKVD